MPQPTITVAFAPPDLPLAFTDVTADVIANPGIKWTVGIFGKTPNDRVAKPGKLTLYMDNSASNSQSTLGFYRFGNGQRYMDYGFRIRITISDGVNPNKIRLFYATSVTPDAGQYGRRMSKIKANDFMGKLSEAKLDGIDIQTSKRSDQVIDTIVDNISTVPRNTDYHVGLDVFPTSLHYVRDGQTSALATAKQLALSDLSFLFNRADATDGETLTWYTRADWGGNTGPVASFDNTMSGLGLGGSKIDAINRFIMSSIQTRIDSAATTVLWALGDNEIEIPASTTLDNPVVARYTDPNSEATRISGTAIVDPPTANTDYKMSSVAGDGGNDLNANLVLTFAVSGNETKITMQNTAGVTGYVNLLQVRGKGVYWYSPVVIEPLNITARTASGSRDFTYTASYWSSYKTLSLMGDRLKDQYGVLSQGPMSFWPNRSDALMTAFMVTKLGDYINVLETIKDVGSSVDDFIVTGETLTVLPGKILAVTWSLMYGENSYLLIDESDNFVVDEFGNRIYIGG